MESIEELAAKDWLANSDTVEEPRSAARRVELEIRKAIITLAMKPGMPLSEKEIAARYGVSRQPVREAFISLSRAGLVEIHPRRGTFVVKISLDRMLEARFIRELMEVAVVRRACQRFDARVRTRMDFYLDAQETAAESGRALRLPARRRTLPRRHRRRRRLPVGLDGDRRIIKAHMDRASATSRCPPRQRCRGSSISTAPSWPPSTPATPTWPRQRSSCICRRS